MAKGVEGVQGKGSIINKGMEMWETWLVPEASNLFQEALSIGQGQALSKTRSSGNKQDQSGVEWKSTSVGAKKLEPYPLGNGEPLQGSKPRRKTIIFIYSEVHSDIKVKVVVVHKQNVSFNPPAMSWDGYYLLFTLCRRAKWSSERRAYSLMCCQSQLPTRFGVLASPHDFHWAVLNIAGIWIPYSKWTNSLQFWNRRNWDLPHVRSWERFLFLVLIIMSDEIITLS